MAKFKFIRSFLLISMLCTIVINIVVFYLFQSLNGLLYISLSGILLAVTYTIDLELNKKRSYLISSFLILNFLFALYIIIGQFFIDRMQVPSILSVTLNLILTFTGLALIIKDYSNSSPNMTNLKFSFLVLFILGTYSFFSVLAQKKINVDLNEYFVFFLLSGSFLFVFLELISKYSKASIQSKEKSSYVVDTQQKPLPNPEAIQKEIVLFFNKSDSFTNPEFTYNDFIEGLPFSKVEVSTYLNHYQNTSFYQVLGEERAKYAAKQLKKSNLYSIEGIMLEAGFKSYSSFISNFRRVYGMSPSEYRSKYFD